MSTLFPPLGAETGAVLEGFSALVDTVFPLPQRFRRGLPRDVAELSRLLTAGRGDRPDAYLGRPAMLSAYLRYFLPWNLYRLSRLLPALALPLSAGAALIDLGSGPLTLPLALWISRPDLRELPLDFRCLDRTGAVLDAGKELFYALAGRDSPWTIRTIRASLGTPLKGPGANLVTALNVFNEIFWPDHRMLSTLAEKNARLLSALSSEGGSILVVEPGIPRSGEFIGALRASLADRGRMPAAPCPHAGVCPFPGRRPGKSSAKWCHFSFETEDAPQALHRLSAAAGLPKERATLSFLLAGPGSTEGSDTTANRANGPPAGGEMLPVRIISDPFPVPSGYGRYGCSGLGAVLLVGTRQAVEKQASGTLLRLARRPPEKRDPKSGALIFHCPDN